MKFGIAENVKSPVQVCTPELFNRYLDSPLVADVCTEIADALETCLSGGLRREEYETLKTAAKKRLPIATFHATFPSGHRKNDDAVPSGLAIYDLDHIPNPRAKWAEVERRKEELGILLAHITPSTEGLRLVFVVPAGASLPDAQAWMARQLGDEQYDACVKDYARCSFLVPREYVLWVDTDALFSPYSPQSIQSSTELLNNPADGKKEKDSVELRVLRGENQDYPQTYEDIPYSQIVQTLEEQMGGQPEHGSRNNFIFSMACHLRYICNDDADWISQVLPTYGEARDKWFKSIRSACSRSQTRRMPRIMRRTLNLCRQRQEELEIINQQVETDTPPAMPVRLPPLIKLLVSKTPKLYRPAVAHAVFPALATHLWKTTFRYIDNVEHEATLMNILMAGTGSGKNCITEPINHIMADIRARDRENLLRERDWKREIMSKGANKDKQKRPEGLVIQEVDPDMTNAAFVQRLADADERFLYAKMNELDQFDGLKTSNRCKAQFQIMCLSFDPGNVYGQTRVGTTSVSERVCIRFNWNACTTVSKGQSYFRHVLTDGPINRINFCTIPEQPIGTEMPVYGHYDESFDEELRPYIDRLNQARGSVECRAARTLARKLVEENADFARLSQSRVYENLSFRATVIAFLKACVLYVAHGCKWDKTLEEFVRWSLRYDLWCKMHFFGDAIEKADKSPEPSQHSNPQNLLAMLPTVFTREEAAQLRQRVGISQGNLAQMLANWKHRGYIDLHGEIRSRNEVMFQQYTKTDVYMQKYG